MNPRTLRTDRVARPLPSDHAAGGWVVIQPDHSYVKLDAVAGWVYAHADGSRDVDQLCAGLRAAVAPEADRALVFEALDVLAAAGLLERRIAPPAGLSRRVLMQRLVGGAALAALTAALGMPRDAAAAEQCGDEQALIDEIAYLQALQGEVADLLEQWYDAADAEPKTDEFYLQALGAKEEEAKKREQAYVYKLEDATEDLADCKVGPSEMHAKKRATAQAQHFKKRAQEMDLKKAHAQAKYAAALDRLDDQEYKRKRQIEAANAADQGEQQMIQASLNHTERRHKAMQVRMVQEKDAKAAHHKRHEERYAKHQAQNKERLIDATERSEVLAEAYALRQSEKAAKDLDQNLVYKLASEANAKASESAQIQRKQESTAKEKEAKAAVNLK